MAITKTITANGSKGHHRFILKVNEDTTSDNSSFISFSFTLAPIQTGWDWANWGSKISYEIKIGDNTFNGTIPAYNGSSTVTLKSENNIEIPHNSDGTKTIDISFSVTDTTGANYTCGNASSSSNLTLSVLHKAPEITSVSVVENNTTLTNFGVDNSTIVQYLSNKTFTITATYDDTTISECNIYHNNILIGTSTTNKVAVNFNQVSELMTSGTNSVALNIALTDNKGGYSTRIFNFSVIKYTRPSLEATSTNIRRKTGNGIVLTDNKVLLNFVGTCYKGNDVIGNANKPTVQYKIWNTSEPSYSTLTTPNTSNITIKDYEISNILYTSAYNYKIKIYDVFTTTESTINLKSDKVPTGVSVWTEYKDRVDFLKITEKGKNVAKEEKITSNEIETNVFLNDKRVYKKIFTGIMPSSTGAYDIPVDVNFAEAWIDESLSYLTSDTETLSTNFYQNSSDYLRTRVSKSNKYIRMIVGGNYSAYTYNLVLAYIKD